jgi:hypothetical protein
MVPAGSSERAHAVLELMALGLTNAGSANRLVGSERTVEAVLATSTAHTTLEPIEWRDAPVRGLPGIRPTT